MYLKHEKSHIGTAYTLSKHKFRHIKNYIDVFLTNKKHMLH